MEEDGEGAFFSLSLGWRFADDADVAGAWDGLASFELSQWDGSAALATQIGVHSVEFTSRMNWDASFGAGLARTYYTLSVIPCEPRQRR